MASITLDAVECDKLFREMIEKKFPQCNINAFKVTSKRNKDSDTPSNSFEIKVDFDFYPPTDSVSNTPSYNIKSINLPEEHNDVVVGAPTVAVDNLVHRDPFNRD